MRLAFEGIEAPITLEEDKPYILTIENTGMLRSMVSELLEQTGGNEGKWVLSDSGKIVSLAKLADIILEPFHLELNQKKVLLKLNTELERLAANEVMFSKTQQMRAAVNEYLFELIYQSGRGIEHDVDFSIKGLLNAVDMRFSCEDKNDIVAGLSRYMELCVSFLGIRVLFIVGLSLYCSAEELIQIFREAAYKKLSLVLIEHQNFQKVIDEKRLLIDNDLCTVYSDE